MKKKLLVAVCAVSMMALCACNLPIVSEREYASVVAERDTYADETDELASELASYEAEVEDLNSEVTDLQTEIALLQTENLNLTSELEDAKELAELSGLGEEVIYEITDKVALKFRVPDGFQNFGNDTYGVSSMDASNIIIRTEKTNSNSYFDFTKEDLQQQLLASYEDLGFDVEEFDITTFELGEVSGYETLIIDMHYTMEGQELQQIEFIIQVEKTTCVIVYTTSSEYGWYDDFLKSVDTIQIGIAE